MAAPLDPRLVRRARATLPFLVALCVVGVGTALLILAQAWLLAESISSVFDTHTTTGLARWAGLLAAVFAGRALLAWAQESLAHRASAAVKSQLRRDILTARLARPTDARTSSSTLITLVTTGLDALDGYYSKYLPQLVLASIVPVVLAIAIGLQDVRSLVIVIITVPLIPVFMALIGWRTEAAMKRRWQTQARLANHFADLVAGLPTLQVFGRARAQLAGLKRTEDASRAGTMGTLRIAFLSSFALELLATLSVALMAVTIGFRVDAGGMDLRTSLFILILAPEVYLPLRQVGTLYHDAADGMAAAEEAFSLIEHGQLTAGVAQTVPSARTSPLVVDELTYTYPDAQTPAVDGVSLRIDPGELVALAGHSGGGKTTAMNCLLGFLTPQAGSIRIGDVDLCQASAATLQVWREQIAYVPQTPGLIHGTVADNVRLGHGELTDAQVRQLLDRCGGQSLGLAKTVSDDAEGLSAGERRRVALARALARVELGGAGLLVLDEPTAGLDADTEQTVLDAVRACGASVLVVSHRPQVLDQADRVVTVTEVAA
ncbi:thiol reductant ABC exporter subunit CydD [Cutibacterium granulosum]|uniref:thiol reductant ABC exporter subunit CydD n=1 Tax=Cutibacterium granulosum TaxID=33011 RepID=UPI0027B8F8C4|nr:thiol reductant ABC exporter subunit CydD [Cutibacterium granulosum]